jgi:hypothetical protein
LRFCSRVNALHENEIRSLLVEVDYRVGGKLWL